MIANLADRAGMSSNTTGTGDITLGAALGAVAPNICSYLDFGTAGITNGQLVSYLILDSNGAFEVGRATYATAGPKITGRTVLKSSNSNALISLTGTNVQVFISALNEDIGNQAVLHVDAAQGLTSALAAFGRANLFAGITTQSLTSGTSATYTAPTNPAPLSLEVFIIGGGGGGSGVSSTANIFTAGLDGTASIFNSITANPGKGATGTAVATIVPGLGGTGGSGITARRAPGGPGGGGQFSSISLSLGAVGQGGAVPGFYGGTVGVPLNSSNGNSAPANSGGGGSSASNNSGTNNQMGAGGGGGELAYIVVNNPLATYTYTIGTGGSGGGSATSLGGNGGSGFIFVIEHYI